MCFFATSLLDMGQASALRSTEEVDGLAWRQSRQNAEDASEACCSSGVGMEVGKEQQAGARRNHTGGLTGFQHAKNFLGSVVMRRGLHDHVLWCETVKEDISGEISATPYRDHF